MRIFNDIEVLKLLYVCNIDSQNEVSTMKPSVFLQPLHHINVLIMFNYVNDKLGLTSPIITASDE